MTSDVADKHVSEIAKHPGCCEQPGCLSSPDGIARRCSVWMARGLLAAAWLMCVLSWRPEVPASFLERLLPPSVTSVAAQRLLELGAAGAYRLVLVGLLGFAAWRGLPGCRGRWTVQAVRLAALSSITGGAILLRYPSSLGAVALVPALVVSIGSYTLARSVGLGWGKTAHWAAAACVAMCGIAAVGLLSATDVQSVVSGMPTVTSQDRERWKDMLSSPHNGNPALAELRLTGDDLTLMAASWLSAQTAGVLVEFKCTDATLRSCLTLPVHVPGLGDRHLNCATQLQPSIADGRLDPNLQTLSIGRLPVPAPLVAHVSVAVRTALNQDADIQRALTSIRALSIADDELLVLCEPERASQLVAEAVEESPAASDELRAGVRSYMQHLVAEASTLPEGDERFLGLIRTAFRFARERSTAETAALESRAALIALGIQIGDPRVRRLAGFSPDERMPRFRYPFDKQVTLRDRNDLARHFFVSAALRSLSSRELSFAVGLIKEQLDAAEGGSGFSFADLTADLAGVQFAQRATGDNNAAAALQARLAEPFTIDDLLPAIDGLPEGLSQDAFREDFGSLTDPRFLNMTVEIQQRMKSCELLDVAASEKQ